MIKIIRPDTAIRIRKKTSVTNTATGKTTETWNDVFNEDIHCEWKNKFGNEAVKSGTEAAKESARIKLWYIPGITADCRIVRLEDGAEFEIVAVPDDVMNRHQQLEIQIMRYVKG